jgi:hypothetical protein
VWHSWATCSWAPERHGGARQGARICQRLAQECRLADSRLTNQHDQRAVATCRGIERGARTGQLMLAPHERRWLVARYTRRLGWQMQRIDRLDCHRRAAGL